MIGMSLLSVSDLLISGFERFLLKMQCILHSFAQTVPNIKEYTVAVIHCKKLQVKGISFGIRIKTKVTVYVVAPTSDR